MSSEIIDQQLILVYKLEKLRNNTRDNKVKALISMEEDDNDYAQK